MHASTAFLVGIGTVGVALVAGLSGGLLIADAMNPKLPQQAMETARFEDLAKPQPLPTFAAVRYVAADLAFIDPSIDGSASAPRQQADKTSAVPPAAQTVATAPDDQAANPADPAPPKSANVDSQAPAAKQASTPEDAYAKAHDADVKRAADRRRAQHWAERRRREQSRSNSDQQARDDYDSGGGQFSGGYSDRRYRNADHWYWGDREWRYKDDAPQAFDLQQMPE